MTEKEEIETKEISNLISKKVVEITKNLNGINHTVCLLILHEIKDVISIDKAKQYKKLKFNI